MIRVLLILFIISGSLTGGVNQAGSRLPIGIYVVRVIKQGTVVQQRVLIE